MEVTDIKSKWRYAASQELEKKVMTNKPKNIMKPVI